MPSKEIKVRVPEEVYAKLRELADKQGRSAADIVREVIVRFLSGEQVDEVPVKVKAIKMRAKRDGVCAFCGQKIGKGEWMYWVIKELDDGRTVKEAWHLDCWENASDTALARKYLELRKLQRIIRTLKKQADQLADVINDAEARKKLFDIAERVEKLAEKIERELEGLRADIETAKFSENNTEKYVKKAFEDMNEKLQTVLDELHSLRQRLEEAVAALSIKIKPARRRRKEVFI